MSLASHTARPLRRPQRALARLGDAQAERHEALVRVLETLTASMTTFCDLFRKYLLAREKPW